VSEPLDVTAAVCTWNSAETIVACLEALKASNVREIVLVDASSGDGTRGLAAGLADKVLTDPRQGLGLARQMAVDVAAGRYFLSVGADNVMPPSSVAAMVAALEEGRFSGVSCATVLQDPRGYLGHAMDAYKRARYYPGERSVIGTPHMFAAELIRAYKFDSAMGWSDDCDLNDRLTAGGHRLAIIDCECLELGTVDMTSVRYRWRGYGRSDSEVWRKNARQWSLRRRLRSLVHPIRSEIVGTLTRARPKDIPRLLPFVLLITWLRYVGWIRAARKARMQGTAS